MSTYRVLSVDDVKAFPPIRWQVHGYIPQGSLGVLFGPPNIGKSFVALDLAHSIGTGLRWLKQRVIKGAALYVAAGEGVSGLRSRIEGWERARKTLIENVSYLTDAVQLHQDASLKKFLKTVDPIEPSFVVFDTLARCFVGGNEDKVEDMGKVVGACDEIRRQTGATVLLVHHTGHPDEDGKLRHRARGSSGLPAAADFMLEIAEKDGTLLLNCTKQKDAERAFPRQIELRRVMRAGRSLSLVPEPA